MLREWRDDGKLEYAAMAYDTLIVDAHTLTRSHTKDSG